MVTERHGVNAIKHHLNTLFVFTEGAYLAKDGQAVAVRHEEQVKLRVPLHNLGGIVCFGRVGVSPALMAACGDAGVAISLCNPHGRFLARVSGFTPGNVLLRREQYRAADDLDRSAHIARHIILGKLANTRTLLLRAARERPSADPAEIISAAAASIGGTIALVRQEAQLDQLRGLEGEAANTYFTVFPALISAPPDKFPFRGRSRRPPLDPVNALLSFLYAMLAHDARSACETVGLDPAVGFLHRDRPGRPSLALDLMEELRSVIADRVALTLLNRGQLRPSGFTTTESGGVLMNEETRKLVVAAYQQRKQETILHPFLDEVTTIGLVVHLQARLLARHLRGDLDAYPPFLWK
jgi:CRISP-associated protein Cas1